MDERSVELARTQLEKSKEIIGKVKAGETVKITLTDKRKFVFSN